MQTTLTAEATIVAWEGHPITGDPADYGGLIGLVGDRRLVLTTTLPSFTGNANDQRGPGFERVANGRVDIGAFEVQTVAITDTPHLTG